jgi:hypothetical protein
MEKHISVISIEKKYSFYFVKQSGWGFYRLRIPNLGRTETQGKHMIQLSKQVRTQQRITDGVPQSLVDHKTTEKTWFTTKNKWNYIDFQRLNFNDFSSKVVISFSSTCFCIQS